MKTTFLFFGMCLAVLWGLPSHAQDVLSGSTRKEFRPFQPSVGLIGGTQGYGVEAGVALGQRLNLRLGTSLLPFTTNTVRSFNSSYDYDTELEVDFLNHHLFLDWNPFPNAGAFFNRMNLTVGVAYFYKAKGTATIKLTDDYVVSPEYSMTPDEVGYLKADVSWKGVAPYAGIGWQNIRIAGPLSLGVDLGVFYLGKPDVAASATNLFEGNDVRNQPILERNLNDYRWLPNLEIGLKFNY